MSDKKATKAKPTIEAFTMGRVHRSELKNADYNPRNMTNEARKKLRRGLKRHGLLAPITWNKRTGNIVGGHQRVSALDAEHGGTDYELTVAVVDLDERREREANILLNNHEAMGDWDIGKLGSMLKDAELDMDGTGFDMADVYRIFGDAPMLDRDGNAVDELADKLRETKERQEKHLGEVCADRDSEDFYVVVVFKDAADRRSFIDGLGLDDNRFQDGRRLRALLRPSTEASAS